MENPTETVTYNVTPQDRIVERGRGCWNCTGFDMDGKMTVQLWSDRRQAQLAAALGIALSMPHEESMRVQVLMEKWNAHPDRIRPTEQDPPEHYRIKSILRMVDQMDHAVASGSFRLCLRPKAPDRADGEFFSAQYLCSAWNGRDGSSVATSGKPLDKLPDELREEKK